MLQEITITNINRKRKWGWSATPTGEDASIETPARPDYEGTFNQIGKAKGADRTYSLLKSSGTLSARWFWDGKLIHSTWGFGVIRDEEYHYDDEDNLIIDREAEWGG